MAIRTIETDPVAEATTPRLRATFVDEDGDPIPSTSLDAVTMTLYDKATEAIINSRDDTDVLADVSTGGVLTRFLTTGDTEIQTTGRQNEAHIALFEFSWDSCAKRGKHEIEHTVTNLIKV